MQDIKEGWVGKQKGSFQILFERGRIDPNVNPKEYTVLGNLDIYGNRCEDKSIKKILSMQLDFMKQETLLQTYIMKLGQKSDRTPDAHCKIAGGGIEFNWGYSKVIYRSKPIEEKKSKIKFQGLVRSVLSKDILTILVCQANACRVRQYMLAYIALQKQQQLQPSNNNNEHTSQGKHHQNNDDLKITHTLIEYCVGLF